MQRTLRWEQQAGHAGRIRPLPNNQPLFLCISDEIPLASTQAQGPAQPPSRVPSPTSTSRSLPPRSSCSNLTRKESELQDTGSSEGKRGDERMNRGLAPAMHISQSRGSERPPAQPGRPRPPRSPSGLVPLPGRTDWGQRHRQPRAAALPVPTPSPTRLLAPTKPPASKPVPRDTPQLKMLPTAAARPGPGTA